MTVSAHWNGELLARSDETIVVEGNHYFLADDVARGVLVPSDTTIDNSTEKKDCLVLTSNSIDSVTQTCARLHGICLVRNKDIRKFLDGIYVEEGGAIPEPEE